MKLIEVTALGLRILGIYLLVTILGDLTSWIYSITYSSALEGSSAKSITYLSYVAPMFASIFLLFFPIALAKLLLPSSDQDSPLIEEKGEVIQTAAFTIIGIFLIASATPDFIGYMVSYWVRAYGGIDSEGELSQLLAAETGLLIKMAIGLYLALKSQSIIQLIEKFRGLGAQQ